MKYQTFVFKLGLLLTTVQAFGVPLGVTHDLLVPFLKRKDNLVYCTLHLHDPSAFSTTETKLHARQSMDASEIVAMTKRETEERNGFTKLYNAGVGYRHWIEPVGIVGGSIGIDQFQNSIGHHFFLRPSLECFTHGIQMSINGYISQNVLLGMLNNVNVFDALPVRFSGDFTISGKVRPWLKCLAGFYRITHYVNTQHASKEIRAVSGFAAGAEFMINTYSSFEVKGTYNHTKHNPFYLTMTFKIGVSPYEPSQGLRGTNWIKPIHQHLYSLLLFNTLDQDHNGIRPSVTRSSTMMGGFVTSPRAYYADDSALDEGDYFSLNKELATVPPHPLSDTE